MFTGVQTPTLCERLTVIEVSVYNRDYSIIHHGDEHARFLSIEKLGLELTSLPSPVRVGVLVDNSNTARGLSSESP